jgi:hypothetical protein
MHDNPFVQQIELEHHPAPPGQTTLSFQAAMVQNIGQPRNEFDPLENPIANRDASE